MRGSLLNNPNLLAQLGRGVASAATPAPAVREPDPDPNVIAPHDLVGVIPINSSIDTAPFLFGATRLPAPGDVVQGHIANCPVGAILIAKAITGPQKLKNMLIRIPVTQLFTSAKIYPGVTRFAHAGFVVAFERNIPPRNQHASIVSSYLYVNAHVLPPGSPLKSYIGPHEILYARSSHNGDPANKIFWPSFIEKGYAELVGGYDKLTHPAVEEVFFDFCGKFDRLEMRLPTQNLKPAFRAFVKINVGRDRSAGSTTSLATAAELNTKLIEMFKNVTKRPTIACTDDAVTNNALFFKGHCYAVAEGNAARVVLRNALVRISDEDRKTRPQYTISFAEFKNNFRVVIQATPPKR